jgi:uncharacterized protein (TIGR03086 family)
MEVVAALIDALVGQWTVGRRATSAELSATSKCPEWSVLDVIGHSIGVTMKFTDFVSVATDHPRSPSGDQVGGSIDLALRSSLVSAKLAWSSADKTRECHLPFGIFAAELAAGISLMDVLAHSWDIGLVRRERFACRDEIWTVGLGVAHNLIGPGRDVRHYGEEVDVGSDAPPERRFLGYLGRS